MKAALGNYIAVNSTFLLSQFVQFLINNGIHRHLDMYNTLEILCSFFKARYAHEYMNVSEGINMFLVKAASLSEYIGIYKQIFIVVPKAVMI